MGWGSKKDQLVEQARISLPPAAHRSAPASWSLGVGCVPAPQGCHFTYPILVPQTRVEVTAPRKSSLAASLHVRVWPAPSLSSCPTQQTSVSFL